MGVFARQFYQAPTLNLSQIVDPEFVKRDPCLNCTLPFGCNEKHPGCRYQNELPVRTVAADNRLSLPLALVRKQEQLRLNWRTSQERTRQRRKASP